MAAKPPPILSHVGAVGVDARSAIVLRKERIEPLVAAPTTQLRKAATVAGVSEWFEGGPAAWPTPPWGRFTGDRTPNKQLLAQTAQEGRLAWVSWDGVDFGLSDLYTIHRINFELPLMARWQIVDPITGAPAPIATPGEIGVRAVVSVDDEEIFEGLFRLDPVGTQLPSPIPPGDVPAEHIHTMSTRWGAHGSAQVPLTEAFRDVLGHPMTLGAFRALGLRLRVILTSWVGREAFSPQWFAGPLNAIIDYRTTPDPTQSAVQFRVASALPMASNLLYDSGKMVGYAGDLHAVPPNVATEGASLLTDAQVWDESDVASGFAEPASFRTLTASQAELIHDPKPAWLVFEWDLGLLIPSAAWRRNSEVSGGSNPNVWQTPLDRADLPVSNLTIMGVEEDPITTGSYTNWLSSDPPPATVFVAYDEMHVTLDGLLALNTDPGGLRAFIWDEGAVLASSGGVPTLYMRPSDGRFMAGWRGAATLIRMRYTLGTRGVGEWDGRSWDGRVVGFPAITRKLDDLLSGLVSAPAGDLALSDHDGAMRRLVAHGQFPTSGLLTDGRPITIRLAQQGTAYAAAPVLTHGITRWPDGEILSGGVATFRILPLELSPHRTEMATGTYSREVYPNVRGSDENRAMPEVLGVDSGGWFPAAVVDPGPNKGGVKTTFRGAQQSGALLEFRLGDQNVPATYYSYVGSHIYATTLPVAQTYFDANIDGQWNVRQRGLGVGAGLFSSAGEVARLLIARTGIPFADMESDSFALYDAPVHLLVTGPTKILPLLDRVFRSGRFRAVQQIGGRWVAVPAAPEHLDAGILIRNYVIVGRPGWTLRRELMGASLDVSYPAAVGTPAEQRRSWTDRSYRAEQQYRLANVVPLELDTTDEGVFEEYAEMLAAPVKELKIQTDRTALYAYPGTTVSLLMDRALAPGGSIAWGLFSVEEYRLVSTSTVELVLRYARTLSAAEQV